MEEFIIACQKQHNIKIVCSHEPEPLGTAGPIAFAKDFLQTAEPFFVFNADVACAFPLEDLIAFHKRHGREGSLFVTKVEEPSRYGVVVCDPSGKVQRFVHRPKAYTGNSINAGVYLFNPSVMSRIPAQPTSMEKEIFPLMAQDEQLYCMPLNGFWMDVGSPKNHLLCIGPYLKHLRLVDADALSKHPAVHGDVLMHESAKIGQGCVIGPNVVIGPDCEIEDGARDARRLPGAAAARRRPHARTPVLPPAFGFVVAQVSSWRARRLCRAHACASTASCSTRSSAGTRL